MTPRERVVAALSHEEPDRVPVDLGGPVTGIAVKAYEGLLQHFGLEEDITICDQKQQLALPSEDMLLRLGVDTRYLLPKAPSWWTLDITEDETGYEFVDEWGMTVRMPKEKGFYFDMVKHPLAGLEAADLAHYDWPAMGDPGQMEGLAERAQELCEETHYALVTRNAGSLFERGWNLRGLENFLIDLMTDEPFVNAVLDKLLELNMAYLDQYLGAVGQYIQVVALSDDLGTQKGPMISPELYREFVKPRAKELFAFVRERTDAFVFFHTCGCVYDFIPDLIDVGVDALNPVQVAADGMDSRKLKEEFGDRLSFWGAIDTQHVLPFGTPEDAREEVRRRIGDLGAGGGYVLGAVHNIQAGVPAENIVAMYDEAVGSGQ